jgi:hypothetical protein
MVGTAGTEFVAKHAVLTVAGVTMAAAKNWRFRWGLKTDEEPVCATDIPRVIHSTFHGEVECESIYVSDDNWAILADDRDVTYTVVGTDKDTQTVQQQKVITALVKIREFERIGPPNAEGVVRAALRGTMTAVPAVA